MNKKTRTGLTAVFIILGILVLIGIIIGIFYGTGVFQQTFSSASYLSIDKIDNVGVGSEFLIYATGGSAEELRIEFTKDQLNQKLSSEGYMVDRGISAVIRINKWRHSYPVTLTENTFKTIGVQDIVPYVGSEFLCELDDCSKSGVPKKGNYILAYAYGLSNFPGKYYCKCVYWNPSSKVGQFYSDASSVDYNIDFTIGSETKSMNKGNPTINLVNGNFRAEYVGNIATLFPKSKPTYAVLYNNGNYQNLISSTGFMYNGINSPETYFSTCVQGENLKIYGSSGVNKVSSCINKYNSDTNVGTSNKNSEYLSSSNTESLIFLGNNLLTNDAIPSFQPTFKIFINAEWVGLKELKGTPKIISCAENMDIQGGTSKENTIIVKNTGASDGQFDYSVMCGSDQVSFTGAGGFVEAGRTETFFLSFSGSNPSSSSDLIGTCTHKITDRKSGISDTCKSDYNIKYTGNVCQAGQFRCSPTNNKVLERCDDLGLKWESYKVCVEVCEFKDNNFQCSESGDDGGDGKECAWYDISCRLQGFLGKLKLLFAIIFGLISGILALSFSVKFTESSQSTGLKIGLRLGSLIIFGLTIGILVWIFASQLLFLVILTIVLISLGIIRGFLNKIKRITG